MTGDSGLEDAARAWLADDPDPETRAELEALLDRHDAAGLAERFGSRLEFGTAGLRGRLGAGPNRMNRVLVRRAAAGLAAYLTRHTRGGSVVVGYDARHKSDVFAMDSARVFAGAGLRAHLLPRPLPTPVLAFAVRHLGADAGVMVTASHNPPADNGYKVYLGDGAQIVPPADRDISAAIDAVGSLDRVALAPAVEPSSGDVVDAYLAAAAQMVPAGARHELRTVYTPLHGVGRDVLLALFERAGFPAPHVVARQGEPDPDFPTVAFPNPEEPGALDLALDDAVALDADVVLANDPDADRLAVAVPDGSRWRVLSGDELGWLLAEHVLATAPGGAERLVATTVVSSTMLAAMAAAAGVQYAETLTGFKWIVRAADSRPGARFVFGYEEALGYSVGDLVRDKDGLTAALVVADMVASARARGETLVARLDALARRHGLHVTRHWSSPAPDLEAVMARLRASPPAALAGRPVVEVEDLGDGLRLPPADVVILRLDGARVVVRPSGTEPKLKIYVEVVAPPEQRASAEAAADDLRRSTAEALGVGSTA